MIFTPYPFQRQGVQWLTDKPEAALFWDMGCGKTPTTLMAIDALLLLGDVTKVLAIAPKRVAEATWATEAARWDNLRHLRISTILGTQRQRMAALEVDADIYVISRDNVQWLCDVATERKCWPWDCVVLDELSSFKNPSAKRVKALRRFRGRMKWVIGLTGTPAPNGLIDLWSQIYLLDKGERLGKTVTSYRNTFFTPGRSNGHVVYEYNLKPGAENQIYERLSDLAFSLRKEDVLQLPGQVYQDIALTLPDPLMRQYKRFEREQVMQAMDGEGAIVAQSAAALTNKLLQFCGGAVYDEDKGVHELHSIKLEALEELIEAANGSPVLVFYAYQHERERIAERIPGCRVIRDAEDIAAWNRKEVPVALAHPASLGYGVNLQHGGHIIVWYGLTWSLELYQQANQRLNRPGQTEVCRIYHLIIKGTHDERVLCTLADKTITQQGLIDALLKDIKGVRQHGYD